jgi:ethanolamine utilization protein
LEITKLIAKIVRQVELAIIRHETAKAPRRKVLIVSKDLEQSCLSLENNQDLKDCCDVDSVDNNVQQVNLEGYSKVIVCDLDNDSLSKLTSGIFDSPYLKLIGSCIMQGKDIAIVEDDIEFLQYQDTAPAPFLAMFHHKLDTLREWGISVRSLDDLVCALCQKGDTADDAFRGEAVTAPAPVAGSVVTKKALTEADVINANFKHQKEILVSGDTIVTEVASEYGKKHGITITVAQ